MSAPVAPRYQAPLPADELEAYLLGRGPTGLLARSARARGRLGPVASIECPAQALPELLYLLRDDGRLFFDRLEDLHGADPGPGGPLCVRYWFASLVHGHELSVWVWVARPDISPPLPEPEARDHQLQRPVGGGPAGEVGRAVPSAVAVYPTAEWPERETWDLVGVPFEGHPDMRRLLLPADWPGHPLQTTYSQDHTYHGHRIPYEGRERPVGE